ncbi:hypothetical protein, partial [Blastomonas sp. UPD001]|uniref:hypothetical protein n=1 Tax=Blastomonas sp. UPD001 TaxID=2217673 RepID=UPI001E62E624
AHGRGEGGHYRARLAFEGHSLAWLECRLRDSRKPVLLKAGQARQMRHQRIPDGHLLVKGLDLPGGHYFAADQVGRDFVALEEGDPVDIG